MKPKTSDPASKKFDEKGDLHHHLEFYLLGRSGPKRIGRQRVNQGQKSRGSNFLEDLKEFNPGLVKYQCEVLHSDCSVPPLMFKKDLTSENGLLKVEKFVVAGEMTEDRLKSAVFDHTLEFPDVS